MIPILANQPILITGAAGFIGFHTILELLKQGSYNVIGIDNLNDYYDPALKKERLNILNKNQSLFTFEQIDISDSEAVDQIFTKYKPKLVVHLAAQAGVRYSIDNPHAYTQSNLVGFMNMLEAVKKSDVKHMVYASSSSVYGANTELPFSTDHQTDHPVSLYAATKKSNEALAFSYSSMYGIPLTGLRFFTVYGPYGRPDMAYFKFTKDIFNQTPITVYNEGNMMRDFTYIDDIVQGIVAALKHVPKIEKFGNYDVPHKLYNIGNNNPANLADFISILENLTGHIAQKNYLPIQTGDVLSTYADIDDISKDLGFKPSTNLETGLKNFVDWYKDFYKVK